MSAKVEIPNELKSQPDYADGYAAAFNDGRFDINRADSEPYCYGYEAGDQAIKILAEAGFSMTPSQPTGMKPEIVGERVG